MRDNNLIIRTIPKIDRSVLERYHEERFREKHKNDKDVKIYIKYHEECKRDMLFVDIPLENADRFLVTRSTSHCTMITFSKKDEYYDSLEDIIKDYEKDTKVINND